MGVLHYNCRLRRERDGSSAGHWAGTPERRECSSAVKDPSMWAPVQAAPGQHHSVICDRASGACVHRLGMYERYDNLELDTN